MSLGGLCDIFHFPVSFIRYIRDQNRLLTLYYFFREDLSKHLSRDHKDSKEWKCKHCEKIFSSHKTLHKHIGAFHIHGRFECGFDGCDHFSSTQNEVVKHYERVHERGNTTSEPVQLTPKKLALLDKFGIDPSQPTTSHNSACRKRPLEEG